MLGLGALAGDRPWRADLLGPGWLNLVTEILLEAYYGHGLPGLSLIAIGSLILAPLAMLLQLVVYGFLAGGILEQLLADCDPQVSFWGGCRRWFWPFFRLSMLGGIVLLMAAIVVGLVSSLSGSVIGPDISALLQLAVQAIVLGWMELARALMVARSNRSVGRAVVQAARMAVRPLVLVIWLLLALPSGALLLAAIVPPTIDDPYSVGSLVVALAFGQAVAFVGAWTRVIRLAVAARLARPVNVSRGTPLLSARPG
jgi:hypothetical protein